MASGVVSTLVNTKPTAAIARRLEEARRQEGAAADHLGVLEARDVGRLSRDLGGSSDEDRIVEHAGLPGRRCRSAPDACRRRSARPPPRRPPRRRAHGSCRPRSWPAARHRGCRHGSWRASGTAAPRRTTWRRTCRHRHRCRSSAGSRNSRRLRSAAVSEGAVVDVPMLTIPAFHRIGAPGVAELEQSGPSTATTSGIEASLVAADLAALGVALAVLGDELDRMADELVADLVEGDLHGALLVEAERRVGAAQRPVAADHDRRALRDLDDPDVVGDGALGLGSLGDRLRSRRPGPRRPSTDTPEGQSACVIEDLLSMRPDSATSCLASACRPGLFPS